MYLFSNKDQILFMVGRGFLKPDLSRLRTDTPKVRKQSLVLMLSILELSGRSTVVRSTISLVDPKKIDYLRVNINFISPSIIPKYLPKSFGRISSSRMIPGKNGSGAPNDMSFGFSLISPKRPTFQAKTCICIYLWMKIKKFRANMQ